MRAAANMPPLNHWPPGGNGFDIMRSAVADWLCQQPEIRQFIFNVCKRDGTIVFDLDSKTWRGSDWRQ
jgi:hypothetical protein